MLDFSIIYILRTELSVHPDVFVFLFCFVCVFVCSLYFIPKLKYFACFPLGHCGSSKPLGILRALVTLLELLRLFGTGAREACDSGTNVTHSFSLAYLCFWIRKKLVGYGKTFSRFQCTAMQLCL